MGELDKIRKREMEKILEREKKREVPRQPIKVTDADFEDTIERYPLVLIDFWTEWCHPCKVISSILDEIAKDYVGKLVCAKINLDENRATAAQFQILNIPTILIFRHGKLVEKIVGAVPKEHILEKIKRYL